MRNTDVVFTEHIRGEELQFFLQYAKHNSSVLEIGAGTGFQASKIAAQGHRVEAIDVNLSNDPLFPVALYDGSNLPFDDGQFDYVFSSNVLEHVVSLDCLQTEISRVLNQDGLAVHIVPTHTWRFWTTLLYYPALPKVIKGAMENLRQEQTNSPTPSSGDVVAEFLSPFPSASRVKRYLKWIGTLCLSPRHGLRGNRLTEIFFFHPAWWRAHFKRNCFDIVKEKNLGICYSGNILFGMKLDVLTRRRLAAGLGSSTVCFVVRKTDGQ